jgi:plasmid maintenance system antidote protein VapI
MSDQEDTVTASEASTILGVTRRRINALIASGALPAKLIDSPIGTKYNVINRSDLESVAERKAGYPKGRPRKPKPI